jgi:hypothetical protein
MTPTEFENWECEALDKDIASRCTFIVQSFESRFDNLLDEESRFLLWHFIYDGFDQENL